MKIPTLDSLYSIKESFFSKLKIDKFAHHLVKLGLTPNKLTIVNLIIGFLSVLFLFNNQVVFACLYVMNRVLDIFDGYIARKFDLKTELGDKLDHWGDLILNILLLLKTMLVSDLFVLAFLAFLTYVGEYLVLSKQGLLHKKFPSGIFAYIYVFGFFEFGLIYQVIYQIVSYTYFYLSIKGKHQEV